MKVSTQTNPYSVQNQVIQGNSTVQGAKAITAVTPVHGTDLNSTFDKVDLSQGLTAKFIQTTLMTEIGNKVNSMLEGTGIDLMQTAEMDWSPEGVAKRIFNFTTSMFSSYKNQHEDMTEEEQIEGFEKLVRSSVREGFEEAMSILESFEADNETISIAYDTMDKLNAKYDNYFALLRSHAEKAKEGSEQNIAE